MAKNQSNRMFPCPECCKPWIKLLVLVMTRGELGMLMVSSSWTKASTGIPESMNAAKIGVPKAFQVSMERSMCGLRGRGCQVLWLLVL